MRKNKSKTFNIYCYWIKGRFLPNANCFILSSIYLTMIFTPARIYPVVSSVEEITNEPKRDSQGSVSFGSNTMQIQPKLPAGSQMIISVTSIRDKAGLCIAAH